MDRARHGPTGSCLDSRPDSLRSQPDSSPHAHAPPCSDLNHYSGSSQPLQGTGERGDARGERHARDHRRESLPNPYSKTLWGYGLALIAVCLFARDSATSKVGGLVQVGID